MEHIKEIIQRRKQGVVSTGEERAEITQWIYHTPLAFHDGPYNPILEIQEYFPTKHNKTLNTTKTNPLF